MLDFLNESSNLRNELNVTKELPIFKYKEEIINELLENNVVIIYGETGSGKTTQIPKYLFEIELGGDKLIGVTQPRRISAINIAKRVAAETRCAIGKEIGYEVRFNKKSCGSTKVKYLTDGILLNNCITDRRLSEYGIIMVDEAHERALHSDVLLGLLKEIVSHNNSLKVIITSATMDVIKFSEYFFNAPIVSINGNLFNVEVIYKSLNFIDYVESAAVTVIEIHTNLEKGDILVFLACQEEIENCIEKIGRMDKLKILPLYSAMEYHEQQKVFEPAKNDERKVIIATTIAETSLTIDGVRFIIDCGYSRQSNFNPTTGIDNWEDVRISKAQADQRKGRAGRTSNGWCYRLYSENDYNNFSSHIKPEILRKNLSEIYMKVKEYGLDPKTFDFIDPPNLESLIKCEQELRDLKFLDESNNLTEEGKLMLYFPVEPKIGKILLSSIENNCVGNMIIILALLIQKNIFKRPKSLAELADERKAKFFDEDGDPFTYLGIYKEWIENGKSNDWCRSNFIDSKAMEEVFLVQKQLKMILKRLGKYSKPETIINKDAIKWSIFSGLYKNLCQTNRLSYSRCIDENVLYIHPGSSLFKDSPEYVLYFEIRKIKKPYMRGVLKLDQSYDGVRLRQQILDKINNDSV